MVRLDDNDHRDILCSAKRDHLGMAWFPARCPRSQKIMGGIRCAVDAVDSR